MSVVRFLGAQRRLSPRSLKRVFQVSLALALVASLLLPGVALAGHDGKGDTYTVRPGDSLGAIALYFDTSIDALMRANGLRNPNHIYVGQVLRIPSKGSGSDCAAYHTVRWGETLSGIALWYGIDEWDLAEANGIYDLNSVYQGQRLCVSGHGSGGGKSHDSYDSRGTGGPVQPQGPSNYGNYDNYDDSKGKGGPARPNEQPSANYDDRGKDGPDRPSNQPSNQPEPKGTGGPDRPYEQPSANYDDRGKGGPERPNDQPSGNHDGRDDRDDRYDGDDRGKGGPDYGGKPKQAPGGPVDFWKGTYYKDKYFSEFVEERQDPDIRFNWYTGKPGENMPEDRFSVHWERWVYFKEGGYRFVAIADDGVRVIIDDQTIIDGWKIQPATEYKSDIYLREGWYKVTVDYYEEAEDAQIHVYWEKKH